MGINGGGFTPVSSKCRTCWHIGIRQVLSRVIPLLGLDRNVVEVRCGETDWTPASSIGHGHSAGFRTTGRKPRLNRVEELIVVEVVCVCEKRERERVFVRKFASGASMTYIWEKACNT